MNVLAVSPLVLVPLGLIPLLFFGAGIAAIFSPALRKDIEKQKGHYAVLGIVSVLIVGWLVLSARHAPDWQKAKTAYQMKRLRSAILNYESEYQGPPSTEENAALVKELERNNPQKQTFIALNRGERNAKGEAIDAWGTPFRISLSDPANPVVQSAGRDRKWDTPDDLSSDTVAAKPTP